LALSAWSTKPAASNRISTILPGTTRSSTKMMTEIPNRVTSIKASAARYKQTTWLLPLTRMSGWQIFR
jgi:hypothetical protein